MDTALDYDPSIQRELGSGDVEEEDIQGPEPITQPFNPGLIRLRHWTPTVDLLMRRINEGELILDPDFQRRAGIWKVDAQSKLIESLLIRIPLPSLYLHEEEGEKLVVVDGVQRLWALSKFVNGELVLTGLDFLGELDGKRFGDLDRRLRRRIEETQLTAYVIERGTPEEARFTIFKRINTGGVPLSAQEIRHALYQGPATRMLKEMAESEAFLEATDHSVNAMRMADRECALRFLAFTLTGPESYQTKDLDGFLGDAMKRINELPSERQAALRQRFGVAMGRARDLFGEYAFRKQNWYGHRSPINKALFEAWSVNLGALTDDEWAAVLGRRDAVVEAFRDLIIKDYEFGSAISAGTGQPEKVKLRFASVASMLKEAVEPQ